MNRIIANIYKKLLNKGKITESDVPEEAKEIYSEEEAIAAKEDAALIPKSSGIKGAFNIPNITRYIDMEENEFSDSISVEEIFTTDVLGDNEQPKDVSLALKRFESNKLIFPDGTDATVNNGKSLSIKVEWAKSTDVNSSSASYLFRVDINIATSNYEPMRVSVYYYKK